ncbi:MAG: copper chaperone PCu(A)C [Gammaproteobacteria bacterium]
MVKSRFVVLLFLQACTLLASVQACNINDIQVKNATVLAGPPGQINTAGYASIHNAGDKPCAIVSATSDFAKEVQLHTIKKIDDRFKMVPVKEFVIPAKGDLVLAPGGNHLMFMSLTKALKPKESVEVTLKFQDGAEKKITATVQDMRNAPAVDHQGH